MLDTQVESGADRGAEPDVLQAAQAEDEAAAQAAVLEEWEAQETTANDAVPAAAE